MLIERLTRSAEYHEELARICRSQNDRDAAAKYAHQLRAAIALEHREAEAQRQTERLRRHMRQADGWQD
jgi:hypothetical protein